MSAAWLLILIVYGFCYGFAAVPSLAWWLIFPFMVQDHHDANRRR